MVCLGKNALDFLLPGSGDADAIFVQTATGLWACQVGPFMPCEATLCFVIDLAVDEMEGDTCPLVFGGVGAGGMRDAVGKEDHTTGGQLDRERPGLRVDSSGCDDRCRDRVDARRFRGSCPE